MNTKQLKSQECRNIMLAIGTELNGTLINLRFLEDSGIANISVHETIKLLEDIQEKAKVISGE